jgi:hypothetical protein
MGQHHNSPTQETLVDHIQYITRKKLILPVDHHDAWVEMSSSTPSYVCVHSMKYNSEMDT